MTDALTAAIAAGISRAWQRQCAHMRGGRIALADGLQLSATGIQDGSVNPVVAWREPADPARAIDVIETVRRGYGVPGRGYDLPRNEYPRLEVALARRGWEVLLSRPGMAVSLRDWTPRPHATVEVVRATTPEQLGDWRDVQQDVFGLTPDATSYWAPDDGLLDPYVSHFVGYLDGKAVTTSVGYDCGDSVGIFAVATRESARGHGAGTAITAATMQHAVRAGARVAWLQATPMGHPVYRAMGFVETGDWVVHERAPD